MTTFFKFVKIFNLTLLFNFWFHLNKKRRYQLFFFLILSIIGALLDMVSLGLALPFLVVLTNPTQLNDVMIVKDIINEFNLNDVYILTTILTISFIIAIIFAATVKVSILILTTRVALNIGKETCSKILEICLNQSYMFHVNIDSNEITNALVLKVENVIYAVLLNVINIISSFVFLIIILITILLINFNVTLLILTLITLSYGLIIALTRKKLKNHGQILSKNSTSRLKLLNETSVGIKDIILNDQQNAVLQKFKKLDGKFKDSQGSINIIGGIPKYFIETIGLVTIVTTAYFVSFKTHDLVNYIPIIGVMIFAAQKSLPLAQQIFSAWSGLKGTEAAFKDVVDFLNLEKGKEFNYRKVINKNLTINKSIEFINNKFVYSKNKNQFKYNFSLKILKGKRIGIVGESGSGKTTLIDIILQLLQIESGNVKLDGKYLDKKNRFFLRKIISHVPQKNFISDTTILENIIINNRDKDINLKKIDEILKITDLYEYVMNQKDTYYTKVGEYGKKISGGQAQRIAIARALYKDPEILILDESTSALDIHTENKLLSNLLKYSKTLTIIFITHRINALEKFDKLVYLEHGKIIDEGSFKKIKNKYF